MIQENAIRQAFSTERVSAVERRVERGLSQQGDSSPHSAEAMARMRRICCP